MNHKELYDQLIQYRLLNKLEKTKAESGKIETHHILPKSCGGTDDPDNLVNLYAKEHFMAHYYLWKIHEHDKFRYQMLNAFWMMCVISSTYQERTYQEYVEMSEEYQEVRIQFAKYISKTIPNKIKGNKNGSFGKHWYYNPLTNESHPYIDGQQPNGWILGRILVYQNKSKKQQQMLAALKKQKIQKAKEKRKQEIENLPWYYEQFQKYGYAWILANYPHTYQTFIKDCKKHLPGFKSQKGKPRKFEAPIS